MTQPNPIDNLLKAKTACLRADIARYAQDSTFWCCLKSFPDLIEMLTRLKVIDPERAANISPQRWERDGFGVMTPVIGLDNMNKWETLASWEELMADLALEGVLEGFAQGAYSHHSYADFVHLLNKLIKAASDSLSVLDCDVVPETELEKEFAKGEFIPETEEN